MQISPTLFSTQTPVTNNGTISLKFSGASSSNVASGTTTDATTGPEAVGGTTTVVTTATAGTISNVPERWSYAGVSQALNTFRNAESGTEWAIEEKVYKVSNQVIAALSEKKIAEPKIFVSGPKSVVLMWQKEENNFYLRIGSGSLGLMISTPDGVQARGRFSGPNTGASDSLFSAMQQSQLPPPK